ncbi:hypothetical protein EON63_09080 [archaeon]|nr:MAG: hypothetical protein EON63_09080 [archaeon]
MGYVKHVREMLRDVIQKAGHAIAQANDQKLVADMFIGMFVFVVLYICGGVLYMACDVSFVGCSDSFFECDYCAFWILVWNCTIPFSLYITI